MACLLSMPLVRSCNDILIFEVGCSDLPDEFVLASPDVSKVADSTRVTMVEALENLKTSLRQILETLRKFSPHEIVSEFGPRIGGESCVIIAGGTVDVDFVVRISRKSR